MWCWRVALLLVLLAGRSDASDAEPSVSPQAVMELDELIGWVRDEGGYVADGVAFGYENSIRGLVVGHEGIKAGQVIMDIPHSVIIHPSAPGNTKPQNQCALVARLRDELDKGVASDWWKYLRMDDSFGVRTMAMWDDAVLNELQGLPPYTPRFFLQWYAHWCKDDENTSLGKPVLEWYHENLSKNEKQALWMFVSRSSIYGIIPLWGLLNHHNGLRNMITQPHDGGMRGIALVDIPPGGTIHISYGSIHSDQMFRNYGFVEAWPQIWSWCSADCHKEDGRHEGETRHRFVLFPEGFVAIEAEYHLAVCANCTTLVAYQAAAKAHTRALERTVLESFVAAAQALLDESPTSIDQDSSIVKELQSEIEALPDAEPVTMLDVDDGSARVRLADTLAAVSYRLQFKQAVHSALVVGTQELASRDQAVVTQIDESRTTQAAADEAALSSSGCHEGHDEAEPSVSPQAALELDELVGWVRDEGGYVADGVAFGYENSIRGLVVGDKGIKAGGVIMDIPNSVIIHPSAPGNTDSQNQCALVARLRAELDKGEASDWWKYLRMDDSFGVRTPALWDDAALNELHGLPPHTPRFSLQWYAHWCKDGENASSGKPVLEWYHEHLTRNEKHALWMFVSRSSIYGIIPLWDLINHHNGLRNMVAEPHDGGMRVIALVDIPPGGTIHISYGAIHSDQMLQNYGFVEAWPQIWSWCSANCNEEDGRHEGETRHRFLLFPEGVVAIEAGHHLAVCANCTTLVAYQAAAKAHTRALDLRVLEGFVEKANELLDGLPTSVEVDDTKLAWLRAKTEEFPDWKPAAMLDTDETSQRVLLTDMLAAVEYRLQFKRAVHSAINVGARELARRRDDEGACEA